MEHIDKTNIILKTATIRIGAARVEERAPSHDGEYSTKIFLPDGEWFVVGNGGVSFGSESGQDWEPDEYTPSYAEYAEAEADDDWDFEAEPDRYGYESRQCVEAYLGR